MATVPEPPWLTAKVDQLLARLEEMAGGMWIFTPMEIVMMQLTEPDQFATEEEIEKWDQTCDNCGAHVPGELFTGNVTRTVQNTKFLIAFGVCARCREVSTGEHPG